MFIYYKEGKCLNQLAGFPLKQNDITFIFWWTSLKQNMFNTDYKVEAGIISVIY